MTERAGVEKRRYWLGGNREEGQDRFFRDALDPGLWTEGGAEGWDACWYTGMPDAKAFEQLTPAKWVNHMPGNNTLTVKSRLAATLAAAKARLTAAAGVDSELVRRMAFFPDTYPMPAGYHALQAAAHAAPERRWILKPKNASRGRDIRVLEDVATVPTDPKWMVQRYVDDPHTIRGHKYVLRLYVLITSAVPLRVYLYHEGFAKLASEPYDLDDLSNVFSHLTNPDINATNTTAAAPVVFIPLGDYRAWLREQGHDDDALFARIHDLVTLTAVAARETFRARLAEVEADTVGCYELLGLDCLIDRRLTPWIMECNLSPSLDICAAPEDGGEVEYRIKRQLVHDMVAMLGLNRETRFGAASDPAERLVVEAATELEHRGGWQRLVPTSEPSAYLPVLPHPRLADMVLADALSPTPVARPTVRPYRASEIVEAERLSLYAEETGLLYHLNPTAAWLWLQATSGRDAEAIADELATHRGATNAAARWSVRHEVYDQLADWAALGLLCQSLGGAETADEPAATDAAAPPPFALRVGRTQVEVTTPAEAVAARLRRLWPADDGAPAERATALTVLRSGRGYGLASPGQLVAADLRLAELAPAMIDRLLTLTGDEEGVVGTLAAAVVADGRGRALLVAPDWQGSWDAAAVALAHSLGGAFAAGLTVPEDPAGGSLALGLPARVPPHAAKAAVDPGLRQALTAATRHRWSWPGAQEGHLVTPSMAAHGDLVEVSAVLLPRAPGGDGSVRLDADAALAALLPAYRGRHGARPSAREVAALHRWLAAREVRALPLGAGAETVCPAAVEHWRDDGAGAPALAIAGS